MDQSSIQEEVKGLDLKIDNSVHELCKVSNETSSHTRGILYFIMLITLLSFVAVVNTHKWNWIGSRIESSRDVLKTKIEANEYDIQRVEFESLVRSKNENYAIVRLPILGIAFDVNNLSLIFGFTLTFLLIVLRFTINREYMNLKMAFDSIRGRYPDQANPGDFFSVTDKLKVDSKLLSQINRKRREHHYNYLSMNEIFNMPPAKSPLYSSNLYRNFRDVVSKSLFALPIAIYLLVAINDYSTLEKGMRINPVHTVFNFSFTVIFVLALLYLTTKIIIMERRITHEYEDFHENWC